MSATIGEFLDRVSRSRILAEDITAEIRTRGESADSGTEATEFASGIVANGLLTDYQARRILAGNYQGLVVNDYVIHDRIGAGGMGEVFRARHRKMNRDVALKLISPQALNADGSVERFRREVEAAAQLDHMNIVTAYDAGECNGVWFLAMQFIEGTDLTALIRECGPLSVTDAIDVVVQIARGLQAAHAKGIIHRDIKPSNVLLSDDGDAKILDMGLARFKTSDETTRPSLTQAGSIMGTAEYMAPEQAEDTRRADERSDIYSLGCTFYFLLTGRPPFQAETVVKQILEHRERDIPKLSSDIADVPIAVELIFQRMLAKDPAQRYPSTTPLIRDLQTLSPPSFDRPAPGEPRPPASRSPVAADDRTVFEAELPAETSATRDEDAALAGVNSTIVVDKRAVPESASAARRKSRLWIYAGITVVCLALVAGLGYFLANRGTDPTPPPEPLTVPELIEQVEKSIVRIDVTHGGSSKIGSGFVINDRGWIVTNFHVIRGAESAQLTFRDGSQVGVKGFVVASPENDLAIIAPVDAGREFIPLPLADDIPKSGVEVLAFGSPKGLSFTTSQGSISAVRQGDSQRQRGQTGGRELSLSKLGLDPKMTWIQSTAPVSPGNSGGPLVNRQGEVVGVTTWVQDSGQNLNFASWVQPLRVLLAKEDLNVQPFSVLFEAAVRDAAAKPFVQLGEWLPEKYRGSKEFKLVHTFQDHKGSANDIAISRESPYLASVGSDGKTLLYDLTTMKNIARNEEPSTPLLSVTFAMQGTAVLAGTGRNTDLSGSIIAYQTNKLTLALRHTAPKLVSVINASPDNRLVVTCHPDGIIDLRRVSKFGVMQALLAHDRTKTTRDASFSSSSHLLLTAADDGRFFLFDTRHFPPTLYSRMQTSFGPITAARFSPNGRIIAAAHADHMVRIWSNWHSELGWKVTRLLPGHTGRIRSLAVSPDSTMIATCGDDKTIRLWNSATGKEIHRFTNEKTGYNKVLFLPSGKFLATAGQNGSVQFWSIPVDAKKKE